MMTYAPSGDIANVVTGSCVEIGINVMTSAGACTVSGSTLGDGSLNAIGAALASTGVWARSNAPVDVSSTNRCRSSPCTYATG